MIKVAIVGNIASGKSTLEKLLKEKKYPIADTDEICHKWLLKSDEIKEYFKDYEVFENGEISRDKLGKLVFSKPELKQKLEKFLYPHVKIEIAGFFAQNIHSKYAFVSIPLLFEANMEGMFDKILFVYCDDNIRLKRLIERNNYTKEYAKVRMDSQISQDEKVKKADWVIFNNGSITELKDKLFKIIV